MPDILHSTVSVIVTRLCTVATHTLGDNDDDFASVRVNNSCPSHAKAKHCKRCCLVRVCFFIVPLSSSSSSPLWNAFLSSLVVVGGFLLLLPSSSPSSPLPFFHDILLFALEEFNNQKFLLLLFGFRSFGAPSIHPFFVGGRKIVVVLPSLSLPWRGVASPLTSRTTLTSS